MIKGFFKRFIVVQVCLVISVSAASAAPVLDSHFDPAGYAAQAMEASGYHNAMQSFTAGASGQLSVLDLYLSRGRYNGVVNDGYDLAVSITRLDTITLHHDEDGYANDRYTLNTTDLGGMTVLFSSVAFVPNGAGWVSVDLRSQHISLEAGQRYAIVLSSLAAPYDFGGDFRWYGGYTGTATPAYPGETLYYRQVLNDIDEGTAYWRGDPLSALGFRTYVDSSPGNVPIPGAVWLFGSGLLGLLGIRRKMKP